MDKKPPLGLKPWKLYDLMEQKNRICDISAAIHRYEEANCKIPEEWKIELALRKAHLSELEHGDHECSFGEGIIFRPNGSLTCDACTYIDTAEIKNVTVLVSKCEKCGGVVSGWIRQPNTEIVEENNDCT